MRWLDIVLFVALACVALGVALMLGTRLGGINEADSSFILSDVSNVEVLSSTSPSTTALRFAFGAVLSPKMTLASYREFADYVSTRLDRPVEIVQGRSYGEINSLVRSQDVDIALVCSGAFVAGRSEFGMDPLVLPVVDGATTYHSYLIVHTGSNANSWDDIRGNTFAFTDPLSNSGRLVPVYTLSRMGETPESFFRNFIFTYSHDKSIHAVANRLVDAAAVDSLVYDRMVADDPSIATRTRVVWKSPPYGINPVVVHPDIDPDLRQELEAILLAMGSDPTGRTVLEELGVDGFTSPEVITYDRIESMIEATTASGGMRP